MGKPEYRFNRPPHSILSHPSPSHFLRPSTTRRRKKGKKTAAAYSVGTFVRRPPCGAVTRSPPWHPAVSSVLRPVSANMFRDHTTCPLRTNPIYMAQSLRPGFSCKMRVCLCIFCRLVLLSTILYIEGARQILFVWYCATCVSCSFLHRRSHVCMYVFSCSPTAPTPL